MDEILAQDLADLIKFVNHVGPESGNVLYPLYTQPALEAVNHLFVVIDKLQDKVTELEKDMIRNYHQ